MTVSTPVQETRDKQPRSILSEEALRKELQSLGPKAAQSIAVVDRLLSLFAKTDFHVEWRSASFTIKVPDPAGSGTLLSLGVVDKSGKFYSYLPWLEEQLKREWQNSEAAVRVTQVLSAFLDGLGFRRTGTGKQWSIDLPALSGKEKALVDGLASITTVIIEEAGKLSPK